MHQILWKSILRSLGLTILTLPFVAYAQPIATSFSKGEWEIYCSNTGTCKAAGYNSEDGERLPASILLTRKAGANQAVKVEVALGNLDEDIRSAKLSKIHFYLNGRDLGEVSLDGTDFPLFGRLNTPQTQALLQVAKQSNQLIFKNSTYSWQVSDVGMTAVLLKMDEVQKRIATIGAIIKKGQADERKVLSAQPILQIKKIPTATHSYRTIAASQKGYQSLQKKLQATLPKDIECEGGWNSAEQKFSVEPIQLYRLSQTKVLATMLCWRAAYNEGYGAWVLNENLSGSVKFISDAITDVDSGELLSAQKGRGIGDCWATENWVWDGTSFVHSLNRWSGMCKGLAMGGVWELDLIESAVK